MNWEPAKLLERMEKGREAAQRLRRLQMTFEVLKLLPSLSGPVFSHKLLLFPLFK